MVEANTTAFRERLTGGQIVYFAEPDNVLGVDIPGSKIVVKKGKIIDARKVRRYPEVLTFRSASEEGAISCGRSPRTVFTIGEMNRFIAGQKALAGLEIDTLVQDPRANRLLAQIMFGAVIERLGDDFVRRPLDPEY